MADIHRRALPLRAGRPTFPAMPASKSAKKSAADKPASAKAAAPVSAGALKKGDHVFLVDGSGYIFRAYHALPPLNRKSDGLQVNAVLGFCNMLWKLLRDMKPEDKPTHLAVIFDKSEKTFRTDFYPDYKAHRPDAPADLIPQFPLIREAVHAFDIPCLEQAGYEADDLIATYARLACDAGASATIVSSDKDLMQLVTDCVIMYDTMKDKKIGIAEVIEKFGVPPEKVIEVQSLIGDSTDNVPGVPGIGPGAASAFISVFGSIEEIYKLKDQPEKIEQKLTSSLADLQSELNKLAGEEVKLSSGTQVAQILKSKFGISNFEKDKKSILTASSDNIKDLALAGNKFCETLISARGISHVLGSSVQTLLRWERRALVSKRLVTLDQHVDLDVPVEDLAVHEPDYRKLVAFLKAMEFSTLTRRVGETADIDIGQIEADSRLVSGTKAAQAEAATSAPETPTRSPSATTLALSGGGMNKSKSGGGATTEQAFTPISLAEARAAKLKAIPFDRSKYEVVRDLARLKAWIMRAIDARPCRDRYRRPIRSIRCRRHCADSRLR